MTALLETLGAFHFLRPWWLLLALAGPLAMLLERRRRREAGGWAGVVAPHLLPAMIRRDGAASRVRPASVAAVLFPVAALALAGPSWQREPSPLVSDRAVMVIALDVSRAGEAALAAGRRKARDIVAARPGARTGLVAYAGTAHAVLPPTDDPRVMEVYLDALSPGIMPRDGTAAGAAFAAAAALLEGEAGAGTVVFLSPGVPASERAAFERARQGSPHGALVLATGPGPFEGAPGATVVEATPDTADAEHIAALAQRHFVTAPSDDPAQRWRDAGPWVALLLVPLAALFARRGFLAGAALLLVLGAAPAQAAEGDLGRFWRLWLTPDQRAQVLMNRGEPARAAPLFTDPIRRGGALFRAGQFEAAATAFGEAGTAEAAYNRGNALMMTPRGFLRAIPAYDRALELRPDFPEARDNRAIAEAFRRRWQAAEDSREDNQTDDPEARPPQASQLVEDQRPPGGDAPPQGDPNEPGRGLSDGEIEQMWMRRVGGTPADFLKERFARQAAGP